MSLHMSSSKVAKEQIKVAIIGSGAAGLACARVLSRNGINPIVFEKESSVGGVWEHKSDQKDRPMYKGLRTNLPREIMAYREKRWGSDGIEDSYVTHRDVLSYLKDYKEEYGLSKYIKYGCTVRQLSLVPNSISLVSPTSNDDNNVEEVWPKIKLQWDDENKETGEDEEFDVVCICNGHYGQPSIPNIKGLTENFKGTTVKHSIEYDDPSIYKDQNVLCIGGRASGSDLAREISHYATHVYLSDTSCSTVSTINNVTWVPRTIEVNKDGEIIFDNDCDIKPNNIDTIIFCTGYDYSFPFVNSHSNINDLSFTKGERRVMPLYEQLFYAKYPNLSFIGLPHSIVPFPVFEFQSEAICKQIILTTSNTATDDEHSNNEESIDLPPLQERLTIARRDATSSDEVKETHHLGNKQWDYCRRMAKLGGLYNTQIENYISTNKAIYDHSGSERKGLQPGMPDLYRSTKYIRNDDNQSFQLVYSEIQQQKHEQQQQQ